MKILLLQIDKTHERYINEGIEMYLKRLRNYTQHEVITINVPKNLRQRPVPEQKSSEAPLIMKHLNAEDQVILLDENGQEMSSREFATFLEKKQLASVKRLVFVTGGPYGFHQAIYDRADLLLSMSRMTFSHQMVRLFFAEQLYRAFTIIKGEKYHHS